jgi:aspartate/methionine/tyrosine aminotransferase
VLLQAAFHAEIGAEMGEFSVADVLSELCNKLITRHEHVFGDVHASSGEEALAVWENAKKKEILVVPCDDFGVSGYVRIAYCVDKQRIVNALPAFKSLAEEYKK